MIRINIKKASGDNSLIMAVSKFESAVTAVIDGKEYNVKSIMSSVAINAADNLELVISGPDEKQAAETIKLAPALHIYEKFGIQEIKLDDYEYERGDIAFEKMLKAER